MYQLDLESSDGTRLEATVHPAAGRTRLGAVVAAHDLGQDMDEGGMYLRLGERLAGVGITVLRFSFRGHGGSDGTPRDVTIEGERLDLSAAIAAAVDAVINVRAGAGGPGRAGALSVVASGFGAVPVIRSLPELEELLWGLVLWQPVLDPRETFLEPRLPWGLANFGDVARRGLRDDGFLLVDGEFQMGPELFGEFARKGAVTPFVDSRVPALIVHGDHDSRVSHEVAEVLAAERPGCELHSVRGSGHGFEVRRDEDEVLDVTVRWLTRRHGEPRCPKV